MAKRKQTAERGEWLTVPQAARRLDVARPTVLQRALLGELTYMAFAGDVFVARSDVERIAAERQQAVGAA